MAVEKVGTISVESGKTFHVLRFTDSGSVFAGENERNITHVDRADSPQGALEKALNWLALNGYEPISP